MELEQLEHVISEIVSLHRSMKNLIEICFAISPLLLLATHGWHRYTSLHSTYLLRVSDGVALFLSYINNG